METQVENAINIAFDPSADNSLKQQAYTLVEQLRTDPSAWQICLTLFTRIPPPSEVVRHVSLEAVNNAIQTQRLDSQSLLYLKDSVLRYARSKYSIRSSTSGIDNAHVQNKFTQTITYLFVALYGSNWGSFFDDFGEIAGVGSNNGTLNLAGTMLYLRILNSVHDEIADVLVPRTPEELKRNNELKDLIRVRHAQTISLCWQDILEKWRLKDLAAIELCLKCISRWVSWVDISLVVNEAILSVLLELAGRQDVGSSDSAESQVRDAAIDTFTEIVAKKMKPSDKIDLINFLNIGNVVGQLVKSRSLSELRSTSVYDNDLAEAVGKLVNTTMADIVRVLDTEFSDDQTRRKAEELMQLFVPYLLRFFSDEYDEVCSTVIPSLTDLLTLFRKVVKSRGALPSEYNGMLLPILEAVIAKMKYDETCMWGEQEEQTDEAEFQELRKRLHILQQTVAAVDERLYVDAISRVVSETFTRLDSDQRKLNWRDLEVALHEMYLFGEAAMKQGGLYQKGRPSSTGAECLIEMMRKMVQSEVASYPHPAIHLQYMENCVRYVPFFEHHQHLVPRVLENFVRFAHSEHVKVRARAWYQFLRFVRHLRAYLTELAQNVIQAIADLLIIKAELPEDSTDDDMSSDEDNSSADAMFSSQLSLFEAVGCIASIPTISTGDKVLYASSIINPLFADLQQHLPAAKSGEDKAVLQIHHIIKALGTLAKGFSDWVPNAVTSQPPQELSTEFARAAEAILIALESLSASLSIREAATFAFSRLLGVLGARILQQLPRWIEGLLSQSSSPDEMAFFLRVLDQVVFNFKREISEILDSLLTPLLRRVFSALAEPATGTDDEIQLAELRREYLNFLLVILNNDLGSVLISSTNQATFETIVSTIEHFGRDTNDYPTARLAFSVLIRMCSVWGGPDIPSPNHSSQVFSPVLPGFHQFMISRFSSLGWALPASPTFNAKDPQARQVLHEVAALQQSILAKTGQEYLNWLKSVELKGMGLSEDVINDYLRALTQSDAKGFRQYFLTFIQRNT